VLLSHADGVAPVSDRVNKDEWIEHFLDKDLSTLSSTSSAQAQPQSPPGKTDADFQKALRETVPAVETARLLAAVNDTATGAHTAMEQAMEAAFAAANAKNYDKAIVDLATASAQADIISDERVKMRDAFYDRHEKLEATLKDLSTRIGKLTAAPTAVTQALKKATDAQAVAEEAGDANPEDWPAAIAALDEADKAVGEIGTASTQAATTLSSGFTSRFNAIKDNDPAGGDFMKKFSTYVTAQKKVTDQLGKDGLAALEACGAAETALGAFEAVASPSGTERGQKVAAAKLTLSNLSDQELEQMSLEDKAGLAFDLCANGTPDDSELVDPSDPNNEEKQPIPGGTLDQLCRLYRKSPPDPKFLEKRDKQIEKIVEEAVKLPAIQALYDADGDLDMTAWNSFIGNQENVRSMLGTICDAQTTAIGMPSVPVTAATPEARDPTTGGITFGGYSPASNSVELNLHPDAVDDPLEALTTILHETFHAHQDVLVKKLKSGEIGPGHEDYATALMCVVNDIGVGYVQSDEGGQENYEKQPTEIDAEFMGQKAAQAILKKALEMKTSKATS
jgi:hypothetical protein